MFNKILFVTLKKADGVIRLFRWSFYKLRGAKISRSAFFPKIYFTWPHKVTIGNGVVIEHSVYFKYDGVYSKQQDIITIGDRTFIGCGTEFNSKYGIHVGSDCLLAAGCRFVDHDHGIETGELMREQECPGSAIVIEDDVWIGANAVVLKGVNIKKGVIVAAGAIVTKSIPAYEIWGGVPAKKIGSRLSGKE